MTRTILAALILAGALPAAAQPADQPQQDDKIRRLVIYGNDPCPAGEGDEVVVCARRPETERFRIPTNLRDDDADDTDGQSWAARAETIQDDGKSGIDSCSASGPGGQTGCLKKMIDGARNDSNVRPEAVPK